MRPFRELRKKAGLPVLSPLPISVFRGKLDSDIDQGNGNDGHGLEKRYSACLERLETVVRHERIRLLDETDDVDPLSDGTDDDEDSSKSGGISRMERLRKRAAKNSPWGAQLVAMQLSQLKANVAQHK
eukprot:SAG31_NODE_3916_length_3753_cov_2.384131_5_plen_128_part_00